MGSLRSYIAGFSPVFIGIDVTGSVCPSSNISSLCMRQIFSSAHPYYISNRTNDNTVEWKLNNFF